jgi:amino acid transporter
MGDDVFDESDVSTVTVDASNQKVDYSNAGDEQPDLVAAAALMLSWDWRCTWLWFVCAIVGSVIGFITMLVNAAILGNLPSTWHTQLVIFLCFLIVTLVVCWAADYVLSKHMRKQLKSLIPLRRWKLSWHRSFVAQGKSTLWVENCSRAQSDMSEKSTFLEMSEKSTLVAENSNGAQSDSSD